MERLIFEVYSHEMDVIGNFRTWLRRLGNVDQVFSLVGEIGQMGQKFEIVPLLKPDSELVPICGDLPTLKEKGGE